MTSRSYEECKETLQKLDTSTLERRIERCRELEVTRSRYSFQKEWDYSSEASATYIAGNFRSTIFCCACAVDQINTTAQIEVCTHYVLNAKIHQDMGKKKQTGKVYGESAHYRRREANPLTLTCV